MAPTVASAPTLTLVSAEPSLEAGKIELKFQTVVSTDFQNPKLSVFGASGVVGVEDTEYLLPGDFAPSVNYGDSFVKSPPLPVPGVYTCQIVGDGTEDSQMVPLVVDIGTLARPVVETDKIFNGNGVARITFTSVVGEEIIFNIRKPDGSAFEITLNKTGKTRVYPDDSTSTLLGENVADKVYDLYLPVLPTGQYRVRATFNTLTQSPNMVVAKMSPKSAVFYLRPTDEYDAVNVTIELCSAAGTALSLLDNTIPDSAPTGFNLTWTLPTNSSMQTGTPYYSVYEIDSAGVYQFLYHDTTRSYSALTTVRGGSAAAFEEGEIYTFVVVASKSETQLTTEELTSITDDQIANAVQPAVFYNLPSKLVQGTTLYNYPGTGKFYWPTAPDFSSYTSPVISAKVGTAALTLGTQFTAKKYDAATDALVDYLIPNYFDAGTNILSSGNLDFSYSLTRTVYTEDTDFQTAVHAATIQSTQVVDYKYTSAVARQALSTLTVDDALNATQANGSYTSTSGFVRLGALETTCDVVFKFTPTPAENFTFLWSSLAITPNNGVATTSWPLSGGLFQDLTKITGTAGTDGKISFTLQQVSAGEYDFTMTAYFKDAQNVVYAVDESGDFEVKKLADAPSVAVSFGESVDLNSQTVSFDITPGAFNNPSATSILYYGISYTIYNANGTVASTTVVTDLDTSVGYAVSVTDAIVVDVDGNKVYYTPATPSQVAHFKIELPIFNADKYIGYSVWNYYEDGHAYPAGKDYDSIVQGSVLLSSVVTSLSKSQTWGSSFKDTLTFQWTSNYTVTPTFRIHQGATASAAADGNDFYEEKFTITSSAGVYTATYPLEQQHASNSYTFWLITDTMETPETNTPLVSFGAITIANFYLPRIPMVTMTDAQDPDNVLNRAAFNTYVVSDGTVAINVNDLVPDGDPVAFMAASTNVGHFKNFLTPQLWYISVGNNEVDAPVDLYGKISVQNLDGTPLTTVNDVATLTIVSGTAAYVSFLPQKFKIVISGLTNLQTHALECTPSSRLNSQYVHAPYHIRYNDESYVNITYPFEFIPVAIPPLTTPMFSAATLTPVLTGAYYEDNVDLYQLDVTFTPAFVLDMLFGFADFNVRAELQGGSKTVRMTINSADLLANLEYTKAGVVSNTAAILSNRLGLDGTGTFTSSYTVTHDYLMTQIQDPLNATPSPNPNVTSTVYLSDEDIRVLLMSTSIQATLYAVGNGATEGGLVEVPTTSVFATNVSSISLGSLITNFSVTQGTTDPQNLYLTWTNVGGKVGDADIYIGDAYNTTVSASNQAVTILSPQNAGTYTFKIAFGYENKFFYTLDARVEQNYITPDNNNTDVSNFQVTLLPRTGNAVTSFASFSWLNQALPQNTTASGATLTLVSGGVTVTKTLAYNAVGATLAFSDFTASLTTAGEHTLGTLTDIATFLSSPISVSRTLVFSYPAPVGGAPAVSVTQQLAGGSATMSALQLSPVFAASGASAVRASTTSQLSLGAPAYTGVDYSAVNLIPNVTLAGAWDEGTFIVDVHSYTAVASGYPLYASTRSDSFTTPNVEVNVTPTQSLSVAAMVGSSLTAVSAFTHVEGDLTAELYYSITPIDGSGIDLDQYYLNDTLTTATFIPTNTTLANRTGAPYSVYGDLYGNHFILTLTTGSTVLFEQNFTNGVSQGITTQWQGANSGSQTVTYTVTSATSAFLPLTYNSAITDSTTHPVNYITGTITPIFSANETIDATALTFTTTQTDNLVGLLRYIYDTLTITNITTKSAFPYTITFTDHADDTSTAALYSIDTNGVQTLTAPLAEGDYYWDIRVQRYRNGSAYNNEYRRHPTAKSFTIADSQRLEDIEVTLAHSADTVTLTEAKVPASMSGKTLNIYKNDGTTLLLSVNDLGVVTNSSEGRLNAGTYSAATSNSLIFKVWNGTANVATGNCNPLTVLSSQTIENASGLTITYSYNHVSSIAFSNYPVHSSGYQVLLLDSTDVPQVMFDSSDLDVPLNPSNYANNSALGSAFIKTLSAGSYNWKYKVQRKIFAPSSTTPIGDGFPIVLTQASPTSLAANQFTAYEAFAVAQSGVGLRADIRVPLAHVATNLLTVTTRTIPSGATEEAIAALVPVSYVNSTQSAAASDDKTSTQESKFVYKTDPDNSSVGLITFYLATDLGGLASKNYRVALSFLSGVAALRLPNNGSRPDASIDQEVGTGSLTEPAIVKNYRPSLTLSTVFTADSDVTETVSEDVSIVVTHNGTGTTYTPLPSISSSTLTWSFSNSSGLNGNGTYSYAITATPKEQRSTYGTFIRQGTFNLADRPLISDASVNGNVFTVTVDPKGAEPESVSTGVVEIFVVSIATPATTSDASLRDAIKTVTCVKNAATGVYTATFNHGFQVKNAILVAATDMGASVATFNDGSGLTYNGGATHSSSLPAILASFN